MRIVHLAAGAGAMYCGACARDAALARGLAALGHDVEVLPLYTPLKLDDAGASLPMSRIFLGGINAYLQQAAPLFRRTPEFVDRMLDHPGLLRWVSRFAVRTKPADLGPMTVSVLRGADGAQAKEFARLMRYLRECPRPDVVSLTNSMLSGIAPEVKRALGVPVVCGVQGEDIFVDGLPEPWRAEAWTLMRHNVESVDGLLAPCAAHADLMASRLGMDRDRVAVVPAGLDAAAFRSGVSRPRTPFVVGFLSSITPVKGLDRLVEAVGRLARDGRDLQLRVAGRVLDMAHWKQVRLQVKREGLASRFEYAGEVDFASKVAFLRGCSAFCVPSRIAESRGVAVMEAMAAGRPVIAPESGVFPELVGGTGGGLLIPPDGSPAEALAALMDAPEKADAMGEAGAEGIAGRYTPARSAQAMQNALTTWMGGRHAESRI